MRLVADEANPLAAAPFYVNPTSAAMRAAQSADPPSPELATIANTPQAYWIVPGSSAATIAKYTGDAQAAGAAGVVAVGEGSNRAADDWGNRPRRQVSMVVRQRASA